MDDRRMELAGRKQMMLGGELLYDPGHPIPDVELARRIRRALLSVGWVKAGSTVPGRGSSGLAT
jgi:hypothetical protein